MDGAFHNICELMYNCTQLVVPLPSDSFSIVTDASGLGIGGILQVQREGEWMAAAYYSRQTKGAETRYSATELEALALVDTIVHFSYYLYGHEFHAFTDHHALLSLKGARTPDTQRPRTFYLMVAMYSLPLLFYF